MIQSVIVFKDMANLDSLNKVWETNSLKKMPNNDKAKEFLDRLAKMTAPIMLRRKWKVKNLKEFYPTNQCLLGMNINRSTICIRLRNPSDQTRFLEWHDILGTMCHELAHMNISPHNAAFYKLWDEVSDEVQNDSLGISSTSSMSGVSVKIGGKVVSKEKITQSAADAAIKRQKLNELSSGSGQKLGGNNGKPLSQEKLRELMAIAAERRIIDDKWCPTNNREIITTSSSSLKDKWICQSCFEENNSNIKYCNFCGYDKKLNDMTIKEDSNSIELNSSLCIPCETSSATADNRETTSGIICDNCTFENKFDTLFCEVCGINLDNIVNTNNNDYNQNQSLEWNCSDCTFTNFNRESCEICENNKNNDSNRNKNSLSTSIIINLPITKVKDKFKSEIIEIMD